MGLLERITGARQRPGAELAQRSSVDQWLTDYLIPASEQFAFGGNGYMVGLNQTYLYNRAQEISQTLPGYSQAIRQCPPAFAAQMLRASVLSQARFTFRNLPGTSNPRKQFGRPSLGMLERPWPNATSGELLSRMEWHAGLAGNAYVFRQPDRLRVLRPDWVVVVYGSHQEPEDAAHALDGEVVGYAYCNGGLHSGNAMRTLLPHEVSHWSPIPDPEHAGIGMSWFTPAIRDIQGDKLAAQHKIQFFQNGATPNLVVKGINAAKKEQFREIVQQLEEQHAGVANAYKTLYLSAGADATVVGNDLRQMDFKNVVSAGENRIAYLSRVPAALLGVAEGLKGSSLNAGNFRMAQRGFADSWIMPTLQDLCSAMAHLIEVPSGAELWYDTIDVGLLREDSKDQAQINEIQARTITILVREGFTAESAIAAVIGGDMTLLKHTGLVSVQLQPPGALKDPTNKHFVPVGTGPPTPPGQSPS